MMYEDNRGARQDSYYYQNGLQSARQMQTDCVRHILRRRKSKWQRYMAVAVCIMVIMMLAALGVFVAYFLPIVHDDCLKGIWAVDSATSFRFDGKGAGAMELPSSEYKFKYSIDGNTLIIDFEAEEAADVEYRFEINGYTLRLTEGYGSANMPDVILHKSDR